MQAATSELEISKVSTLFRALGDETRLRIVALLVHGELCVCHLQDALGASQPNISRHMAVLRSAGVVRSRREGTWIYYRLEDQEDPHRAEHLRALIRVFGKEKTLHRDVEKLLKSKGPDSCR